MIPHQLDYDYCGCLDLGRAEHARRATAATDRLPVICADEPELHLALTRSDKWAIAGAILAVVILGCLAVVWGCHFRAPRGLFALWGML